MSAFLVRLVAAVLQLPNDNDGDSDSSSQNDDLEWMMIRNGD
jgi:hypothetical protein